MYVSFGVRWLDEGQDDGAIERTLYLSNPTLTSSPVPSSPSTEIHFMPQHSPRSLSSSASSVSLPDFNLRLQEQSQEDQITEDSKLNESTGQRVVHFGETSVIKHEQPEDYEQGQCSFISTSVPYSVL